MERKLWGKNFRKFGYTLQRLSSFLEILKNAVPFKLTKIQTRRFS